MIWTALIAARSFLAKIPWQVWAVAAVLLSAWLWGNHRYEQGVDHERARWEAAAAKAQKRADKATVTAGEQRAADTIRNHDADTARKEAINASPDDPYRALACHRLHAAGQHAAAAEAGCGSSNRSETGSPR